MRDRRLGWLLLVLVLLAAGCGADDADDAGGATGTAAPTEEAQTTEAAGAESTGDEVTVAVADSDFGEILVDGDGRTLYAFLNDEGGTSSCVDDCAANWPPLVGAATAGEGADGALLGTTERDDGAVQVVYGEWPLYYFAGDSSPGDTTGQGVGDVWYVVDAAGEPVRESAATDEDPSY